MSLVERWVGEKLHDILGISDKTIASYFVGLAQKASSPENFIDKLVETGSVEVDANVTNFAKELWGKVNNNVKLCYGLPLL